jgi:hypothetical protein
VLIVIAAVSGLGYWIFSPGVPDQTVSATHQSPLTTSIGQTAAGSTASTSIVSETTQWINVRAAKPVSYYLSLLKSTGSQPYVQLAQELQALPDATNATAVAKITYLALNATNPEVKEAFELMIKGGTSDPWDFTYTVPNYNTELEVLYWLALQSDFKRDDTLALAIVMVNGLWVTMGDDQARQAVRMETADLLGFFRNTSDFQRRMGWRPLEEYPLDAKILLAWTGDDALKVGHGPHTEVGAEAPHSIFEYGSRRVDLKTYKWNNVDAPTLTRMQEVMLQRQWVASSAQSTYEKVEEYFLPIASNPNWYYTATPDRRDILATVDGEQVTPYVIHNARFLFEYFLQTGKGFGVCDDQATLVSAFLKSVGIPSNYIYKLWAGTSFGGAGHTFNIYYDGKSRLWTANPWQLSTPGGTQMNITIDFYLFRPPVTQARYLHYVKEHFYGMPMGSSYYTKIGVPNLTIYKTFLQGVTSAQMKQWLLYS